VRHRVKPEHTIKGATVRLTWFCRACGHEWNVVDQAREKRMRERRRQARRRSPDRRRRQRRHP
jgi:hypothetical protein